MDLWKVPPAVRMDRMGHSDPRMMMNYTHLRMGDPSETADKQLRCMRCNHVTKHSFERVR